MEFLYLSKWHNDASWQKLGTISENRVAQNKKVVEEAPIKIVLFFFSRIIGLICQCFRSPYETLHRFIVSSYFFL